VANIAQTTATEALAGLVERVTFHNPENGFCVLRVKARGQRDLVTVVGHAAMISAGEFVQMSGVWVNDRDQSAAILSRSDHQQSQGSVLRMGG
jgi:exodeoxyribonuclease V alpha subunit